MKNHLILHRRILDHIRAYQVLHGRSPSLREISRAVYLSAPSVAIHLDKMQAAGWITREPYRARSIKVIQP